MYKNFKNNNAITLIALIITIIILLILAGVTIAQLTESGLFEKTKLAEQKSENAQIQEDITLGKYENKIDEVIKGSSRLENTSKMEKIWDTGLEISLPSTWSAINKSISWTKSIKDYDYITIVYMFSTPSTNGKYAYMCNKSFITAEINPNSDYTQEASGIMLNWEDPYEGDDNTGVQAYFSSNTELKIYFGQTEPTGVKMKIKAIYGTKL